ncbi:MAG: porin [Ignavibacteriae bacterium]|nr:porin [Ignavibacteriota bacterium]
MIRQHALKTSRPRISLFVIAVLLLTNSVAAQDTAGVEKKAIWYDTIVINGFTSASFSYNTNVPDSRKNQMRVFDTDDNSFKIDVIELALQKPATNPGDVGFCFHLTAGSSVPKVARSSGLDIGDLDFHQMYVRYIAKVGRGLTIDFGKFVTPLGYELIEGYDGYNDNVTRSFLFGYAIPFTHTGVRVGYPMSDAITATVMIVNGWDNAIDNNRSKSVGGQLMIVPVTGMTLCTNYIFGPELNENNSNNRSVADVSASYAFNERFTLGLNADYGAEQRTAPNGKTAKWNGVAAYFRLNATTRFSMTLRAEHFEDHDGGRTGFAQRLHEFTLTPEFRPTEGLVLRGDIRLDTSSGNVFEKRGGFSDKQLTFSANMIFIY